MKSKMFIVNMSALFIPRSVGQNLMPPAAFVELKEKPIQVVESQTFLTYANIPFQQQVMMMPSMNAIRYDIESRHSRMFGVISHYNNNPQPPGTILLFQDLVSFYYGLEHNIVIAAHHPQKCVVLLSILIPFGRIHYEYFNLI